MQVKINAPPEEIITEAAQYMVNKGASIESQTDTSITFKARGCYELD